MDDPVQLAAIGDHAIGLDRDGAYAVSVADVPLRRAATTPELSGRLDKIDNAGRHLLAIKIGRAHV